jgi:hypothetical protein
MVGLGKRLGNRPGRLSMVWIFSAVRILDALVWILVDPTILVPASLLLA